jgi:hypothetical protein
MAAEPPAMVQVCAGLEGELATVRVYCGPSASPVAITTVPLALTLTGLPPMTLSWSPEPDNPVTTALNEYVGAV